MTKAIKTWWYALLIIYDNEDFMELRWNNSLIDWTKQCHISLLRDDDPRLSKGMENQLALYVLQMFYKFYLYPLYILNLIQYSEDTIPNTPRPPLNEIKIKQQFSLTCG